MFEALEGDDLIIWFTSVQSVFLCWRGMALFRAAKIFICTTLVLYCPNAGNIFSEKKGAFLFPTRLKAFCKDLSIYVIFQTIKQRVIGNRLIHYSSFSTFLGSIHHHCPPARHWYRHLCWLQLPDWWRHFSCPPPLASYLHCSPPLAPSSHSVGLASGSFFSSWTWWKGLNIEKGGILKRPSKKSPSKAFNNYNLLIAGPSTLKLMLSGSMSVIPCRARYHCTSLFDLLKLIIIRYHSKSDVKYESPELVSLGAVDIYVIFPSRFSSRPHHHLLVSVRISGKRRKQKRTHIPLR